MRYSCSGVRAGGYLHFKRNIAPSSGMYIAHFRPKRRPLWTGSVRRWYVDVIGH